MITLKRWLSESQERTLWIIRGIPGSGKSTFAKSIVDDEIKHSRTATKHEADDYFIDDETGVYNFDPTKLPNAHLTCMRKTENDMKHGIDTICVSNTFIRDRDVKPYVEMAKKYGYTVKIKVCDGGFKNVHNVSTEKVQRMADTLKANLTSSKYQDGTVIKV